jgi:hypothetical protein
MLAVVPTTNALTRGITAAIEGIFAALWFSWGQAGAPSWLRTASAIGTVAGLVVAAAGIVLAARSRGQPTAMRDPAVRQRYNAVVGAEFGLLGIGAVILGATGLTEWIAVWVCAGVGLHFLVLAGVFRGLLLIPLGSVVTAIAGSALIVGLTTSTRPSTVAGPANWPLPRRHRDPHDRRWDGARSDGAFGCLTSRALTFLVGKVP